MVVEIKSRNIELKYSIRNVEIKRNLTIYISGYIRVWSVKRVAIGRKERERLLEVADYNFAFPFAPYLKKMSRQLAATEPLEIFAEIPKLSVPLLASFKGHLGAVTALGW